MNKLFGIFSRNNLMFSSVKLQNMIEEMSHNSKNCFVWSNDGIILKMYQPRCVHNSASFCQIRSNSKDDPIFISAGRLDNISELARLMDVSQSERLLLTDHEWMQRAYKNWGEACVEKLLGDWTLAAWHPLERKLFLARDHFGNTTLYYYVDHNIFAFATSLQTLLDLNLAPIEMDELYLAQVIVSWQDYHGERTIHAPIRRLPPAHSLTVDKVNTNINRYWTPEKNIPLCFQHRLDYVDAFREIFDEAVRARLRVDNHIENSPIAVTLSSGLDSSSVAVTAASYLRQEGKLLKAFTSIPISDTTLYVGSNIGNELPLANMTSKYCGNINLYPVDAVEVTPIQAIRRTIQILKHPSHAAGNFYWILQLASSVRDHGCNILLTGQQGNAGLSWAGDIFSQSIAFQIKTLGFVSWFKQAIKRSLPHQCISLYQQVCQQGQNCRSSAIHPDFAHKLQLAERWASARKNHDFNSPLQQRLSLIRFGFSITSSIVSEIFGAYNIETRDPTADVRLLEFIASVPDHIFMDPKTGIDRWLIREAMKDRMPEQVRLNRRHGQQAADLVPRLRSSAIEVEVALDELRNGPASTYVDVNFLQSVWYMIQTEDSKEAHRKSVTILTRGIMAGLFVNQFYE